MSSPLPTVKFRARSLNLNTSTAGLTGTLQVDAPTGGAKVVPAELGGFGSAVPFAGEPDTARGHEVAHPPAAPAPVRFRRAPRKTESSATPVPESPESPESPVAAVPADEVAPARPEAAPEVQAAPAAPAAKRNDFDEELAEEIELLSTAAKPRAKREMYSAIVGRPEAKAVPAASVPANGAAAAPAAGVAPAAAAPVATTTAAATTEAPLRFNPEQWAAAARAARAPREAEARGGFLKRTFGGLCALGVLGVGGFYAYTTFVGQPAPEVTQVLVAAKAKAAAALPESVKQVVGGAGDTAAATAAGQATAGKATPAVKPDVAGAAAVKPAAGAVAMAAAPAAGGAANAAGGPAATGAATGVATAATGAGEAKESRPAMSLKETIDHVTKLPFKSIEQTKKVVAMNNARVALTDAVINEETRDEEDQDTGPTEVPDGMSVAEFKKTAKGAAALKKKSGVRNAAQEGVVLAKTSSLPAREIDAFDSFVMSAKISAVVPPRAIINETLYTTGATVHHGFNILLHAIDTENRLIVFQHASGRLGTRRY